MADEFDIQSSPQEDIPQTQPTSSAPSGAATFFFEWLQMITGCVLAAVLIFNCFARLTRVDGASMDNTLKDGELLIISDLFYQPQQGDIVVLNKKTADLPGWNGKKAIVKRVIALGGQTVDIDFSTGSVYVDGALLKEDYINELTFLEEGTEFPLTVPENSVFVMGDNRNHSSDSRDSRLGTVDERYVIGKAVFLAFPGADQYSGERSFGRIGGLR